MTLPDPKPGLVVNYRFLWSHEQTTGADEGAKDRPCAVVVATRRGPHGDIRTTVPPMRHRPPDAPTASMENPAPGCAFLGLGGGRPWPRLDRLNTSARA